MKTLEVELTDAQIMSLPTTPVEVVPARDEICYQLRVKENQLVVVEGESGDANISSQSNG